MDITYFNGKTWSEITRDERYFCFELYNCIKQNQKPFIKLIANSLNYNSSFQNGSIEQLKELLNTKTFDAGVEACFYRDLAFDNGVSIKKMVNEKKLKKSVIKRTFDLALFSKEAIIIIEAKAQQGFDTNQINDFVEDSNSIFDLFNILNLTAPKVFLVGLHSGKYKPKSETKNNFHALIKWEDLGKEYPKYETLFNRANKIYGEKLVV